jgi:hypothetical protein
MTLAALMLAGCAHDDAKPSDPTATPSDDTTTPTTSPDDTGTIPTDPGDSGTTGSVDYFDPDVMMLEAQFGWDGTGLIDVLPDGGNPLSNEIIITLSEGYPDYYGYNTCIVTLQLTDASLASWAGGGGWWLGLDYTDGATYTTCRDDHALDPKVWGDDPGTGFANWGGWGAGIGPLSPKAEAAVPSAYADYLVGGIVRSGMIPGGEDDFYQTAGFAIDDAGAMLYQDGDPVFLAADAIQTADGIGPGFYHLFALSLWQLQ